MGSNPGLQLLKSVGVGPNPVPRLAESSHIRLKMAQNWPTSAQFWPRPEQIWPTLVDIDRCCPGSEQIWPNSALALGPNMVDSGAIWTKAAQMQPMSARFRPGSAQIWRFQRTLRGSRENRTLHPRKPQGRRSETIEQQCVCMVDTALRLTCCDTDGAPALLVVGRRSGLGSGHPEAAVVATPQLVFRAFAPSVQPLDVHASHNDEAARRRRRHGPEVQRPRLRKSRCAGRGVTLALRHVSFLKMRPLFGAVVTSLNQVLKRWKSRRPAAALRSGTAFRLTQPGEHTHNPHAKTRVRASAC